MQKLRSTVTSVRELPVKASARIESLLHATKSVVYYSIATSLVLSLLLSLSAFMYGTFYFAFVPSAEHEGPVHPFFEPCQETIGRCGFLNASEALSTRDPVLMTGQQYTVSILLEMPESPVNRQLGMFLNCLQLRNSDGKVIRSELLRIMETFVFAPIMLSGYSTEKQFVHIEFFNDFLDDPLSPAVRLDLQIMSRFVEVYTVKYIIHANFSGLRHFMFYYPVTSAFFGVSFNLFFLSVVILLSWYRFFAGKLMEDETDDDLWKAQFDKDVKNEAWDDDDDSEDDFQDVKAQKMTEPAAAKGSNEQNSDGSEDASEDGLGDFHELTNNQGTEELGSKVEEVSQELQLAETVNAKDVIKD